jgi:hypothetical protein
VAIGAGIGVVLALVVLLVLVRRSRKVKQLETSEDHNLLLLAERDVEALLAKERDRPDVLPIEMLDRRFKHARKNEIVWVDSNADSARATIAGYIFINPEARIYKTRESTSYNYPCKVVLHDGEIMIEAPNKASFTVKEDQEVEGWTKTTLVTVVKTKTI